MKTLRDVLFNRHQSAETKLDAIRQKVVAENIAKRKRRLVFSPTLMVMKLWQELVWPCRRIWTGLAAVWVVIMVFSFAGRDGETVVADNAPPTPEMILVLKEQRQMMAQLLEATPAEPADKPRVPGPRSEQRQTVVIG